MVLVKFDQINRKYKIINPDRTRLKTLGVAVIYKGEQFSPREQVKSLAKAFELFGLNKRDVDLEFYGFSQNEIEKTMAKNKKEA
jgi:hypothetical protein